MTAPDSVPSDDAALLARLGRIALQIDPPPAGMFDLGRNLFSLYRIDDEVAALVADSLTASGTVRASTTDVRLLSFESTDLTVVIQASHTGGQVTMLGQLLHGDHVRAAGTSDLRAPVAYLESPDGPQAAASIDADDRFQFSDIGSRLLRLRITMATARSVVTAWTQF